jgi:tungstate transport system substrate-binding protein
MTGETLLRKKSTLPSILAGLSLLLACALPVTAAGPSQPKHPEPSDPHLVRACVIGGMTMTGLWDEIVKRFEAKHPYKVKMVATGPRPKISVPFRRGEADFLVMHSGDITTDLVADGYGINMRPCARNDLVLLGPASDPAGVRGLKDGAEALKRIAQTKSTFLDVNNNGSREVGHTLWQRAGIRPRGEWYIQDEAPYADEIPVFADGKEAYFIFGRMPITLAKHPTGKVVILVEDDPTMRRPYILMEANPARHPRVNHAGAKALADFILSAEIQNFMAGYGKDKNGGCPFFYPVWPYGPVMHPVE